MKTPEQLAEEFAELFAGERRKTIAKKSWWTGYQAAKDQVADADKVIAEDSCEHILDMEKMVDADKVMFCVYCNDTHKGNCAIGKGKNHPAFGFSEIVVKIESSWVSVKDRLPEDGQVVLTSCEQGKMFLLRKVSEEFLGGTLLWKYCCGYDKDLAEGESYCYEISHWMPLPELPGE